MSDGPSDCRERPQADKYPPYCSAIPRNIYSRRLKDPRCHTEIPVDTSAFWHMASKQPRSFRPIRGGTQNSVQDPSFASGWYEILLNTASGYTDLLHDFFQKTRSRYPERADTSLAAPALAPDTMSNDQCTLSMVASTAKDLVHTVDRLRALHGHGVPPADLRNANTSPTQGNHPELRDSAGQPADPRKANTGPIQGTHLEQPRCWTGSHW